VSFPGGMTVISTSVTLASGGSLTSTAPGAGVFVWAAHLDVQAGGSIAASKVEIQTLGGPVHLGTSSDTGFGLSAAELNRFTASQLKLIGFGGIFLDGPIAPSGLQTLFLMNKTSGTISQSAGATVTVPRVALDDLNPTTLNEANVIGSLAAVAGGPFVFRNSSSFEVAPVATLGGITTASGTVTLNANAGIVTIGAPILTNGAAVTVTAPGGVTGRRGGDVDGNSVVNVSDVFYLINFLFAGGAAPL
jgi:hypothetical protein